MIPVFDLGGVLIDWNPRHLYRKIFADHDRMEWFLANICNHDWNIQQDAGRSFDEAVKEATARHPEWRHEIALYRDRWMEMVSGDIPGTVAILDELRAKGPVYAITNWNGDTFRATWKHFPFLAHFKDIVVSGDERLIKPEPEIFHLLARRNGLKLEDCIFIDDSAANANGAQAVGMAAHHFTSPERLRADLKSRGLL